MLVSDYNLFKTFVCLIFFFSIALLYLNVLFVLRKKKLLNLVKV